MLFDRARHHLKPISKATDTLLKFCASSADDPSEINQTINELLNQGANIDGYDLDTGQTFLRISPISVAIYNFNLPVVIGLMEAGCDLFLRASVSNQTALEEAKSRVKYCSDLGDKANAERCQEIVTQITDFIASKHLRGHP